MRKAWRRVLPTCTTGFIEERIGRSHHGEFTSRNRMGGNAPTTGEEAWVSLIQDKAGLYSALLVRIAALEDKIVQRAWWLPSFEAFTWNSGIHRGCGRGPQSDLRGGLRRFLVRFSAGAQRA